MAEYTQQQLLDLVNSSQVNPGNDRVRQITQRIVSDLFRAIDDLDIKPDEFWAGVDWLARLGGSGQLGLITAGLGFDRLIDIREEEADEAAGRAAGTPRAIEGPLYIAGAPLSDGEARLDEDPAAGTVLVMEGQVRDVDGNPVAGALVDVWHANELGRYSRPTRKAATAFAASSRRATRFRRTAPRPNCSGRWAAMATGRPTSTSWWRPTGSAP
jgi:catechol 1,2-dioxygenase